jgi:hypothetical protein
MAGDGKVVTLIPKPKEPDGPEESVYQCGECEMGVYWIYYEDRGLECAWCGAPMEGE